MTADRFPLSTSRCSDARFGQNYDANCTPNLDPRADLAVSRRTFLVGALALLASAACRADSPSPNSPPVALDLAREITATRPHFVTQAHAFIVALPERARPRARRLLPLELRSNIDAGLLALSDRCPNEEGPVTHCASSSWFVCPYCGSQFDQLGAKRAGPAVRGLNLYRLEIRGSEVSVVTKPAFAGLSAGTLLAKNEPAGPFC